VLGRVAPVLRRALALAGFGGPKDTAPSVATGAAPPTTAVCFPSPPSLEAQLAAARAVERDTRHMATGARVLIVEDDAELRSVLARGLREEGFTVETVATGGEVLARAEAGRPDVLVVDIGLPDADGRDVVQALRARGVQTPMLFLTARDALVDRLAGFDAGGDDYLTKPFALAELVVRLQALLRRSGSSTALQAAGLRLDPVTHAVAFEGAETPLTPTEFRLLAGLLSRPGQAVRRRELVRAGWPHGAIVRENTLDAYVARLRRKLRELGAPAEIVTVHGVGYKIG
jgi:two-component system, OmpR family, response regulator